MYRLRPVCGRHNSSTPTAINMIFSFFPLSWLRSHPYLVTLLASFVTVVFRKGMFSFGQKRVKKIPFSQERVLIIGATSGVGRKLVGQYARRGAKVRTSWLGFLLTNATWAGLYCGKESRINHRGGDGMQKLCQRQTRRDHWRRCRCDQGRNACGTQRHRKAGLVSPKFVGHLPYRAHPQNLKASTLYILLQGSQL